VERWYLVRMRSQRVTYRGRSCDVTLSIGLANSGDLQIEAINQEDDSPGIFTEFLSFGWEASTNSLCGKIISTLCCEAPRLRAGRWSGREARRGTRLGYLEPAAGPAAVLELMELTDATMAMAKLVRDAAEGWDRSDPTLVLWSG
jgi:hypothetical protein